MKFSSLIIFCHCLFLASSSLIGEFLSGASSLWPKSKDLSVDSKPSALPKINFELPKENEEFLQEGLNLIGAVGRGSLDKCNHRVVMTLKKNCNQLTMDEIGKLAVMMLNCQLEIEGRETFLCKPEMTLQECTNSMNEQMYQIYNYMVMRASGICTALKQEQLRAMTELTINRLIDASQSQIEILYDTLNNQKTLYEKSKVNTKEHDDNNEKIREAHSANFDNLKIAEALINENIENLHRDLELRKSSESKLDEIDQTINAISVKLVQQSAQIHSTQELFVADVEKISEAFRRHNQVIFEQHRETLSYLESLRDIITFLSAVVDSINDFKANVLEILRECGLEMTQDVAILLLFNFVYFLSAMVFLLFLDLKSKIPKNILITTVLFNTASIIGKTELPLLSLNIFVWFMYLMTKVFRVVKLKIAELYVKWRNNSKRNAEKRDAARTPLDTNPRRSLTPVVQQNVTARQPTIERNLILIDESGDDNEISTLFDNSLQAPVNRPMTPAMRRVISESVVPEQNRSLAATPFLMGMSGRIQCIARTVKGVQCKNAAVSGMQKCRVHNYN